MAAKGLIVEAWRFLQLQNAESANDTHEDVMKGIHAGTFAKVVKFFPQTEAQKKASAPTQDTEAMEEDPDESKEETFVVPSPRGRTGRGRSVASASPSPREASGSDTSSRSRSSRSSSASSISSTESLLSMMSSVSDDTDGGNAPGIGLHDAGNWTIGEEQAVEKQINFAIASATTHVKGTNMATTVAFGSVNARAMWIYNLLMRWWTGV